MTYSERFVLMLQCFICDLNYFNIFMEFDPHTIIIYRKAFSRKEYVQLKISLDGDMWIMKIPIAIKELKRLLFLS